MSTWAFGLPQPVTGSQPDPASNPLTVTRADLHGVVALGGIVERAVVVGAAADLVDGGVDEAEAPACVLIGQGRDRRPDRRARARAAGRVDAELAAVGFDEGDAGVWVGVGRDVGHAPASADAGHVDLVGRAGEVAR